jgi:DNA (cytosine-5)-methyltransferase 1
LEHSNRERQQEQRHRLSDGSKFFGAELSSVDWQQVQWIDCLDGKQRPVEPSIRLLAHGIPNRVAMLRGYGNAIVPQVAAEFIKAAASVIH